MGVCNERRGGEFTMMWFFLGFLLGVILSALLSIGAFDEEQQQKMIANLKIEALEKENQLIKRELEEIKKTQTYKID